MNEDDAALENQFRSIIEDLLIEIPRKMREANIPGSSIALISKNKSIWTGCFGHTDLKREQKVNADTLFCLQSTTKTVTSIAFLLATQNGLVKLDDPLVDYYPEFTVNSRFGASEYKKISFRHLLSHSSGLAMEARKGGVFNYDVCTFEEHVRSVSGSWLKFPVGTGFSYSNVGMDIVAYALERITKMPYPEYVQKTLGNPLGITFHYDTQKVRQKRNAAKGHLGNHQALTVDPVGLGCGAAHLSIRDQSIFARFLLGSGAINNKQVLNAEYIEEMKASDKEGWYGLGTFISKHFGATFFYHPGGGYGLRSELYWIPACNFSVVAFANQENENVLGPLTREVVRKVLMAKGVDSKTTDFPYTNDPFKDVNKGSLERLEGVYHGAWSTVGVKLYEKKLHLTYPDRKVELRPHSTTAFSAKSPKGVVFQFDKKGNPISMKMYSENLGILHMNYLGKPTMERGPNRETWSKFTGKYVMTVYGTIRVSIETKVDPDGYLHLEGWSNERLYEHPTIPNLFFTYQGDAAIFTQEHMLYGNTKWKKVTY